MPQLACRTRCLLIATMLSLSTPAWNFAQVGPGPGPSVVKPGIFVPPTGLTKPVDVLLRELGFLDCCCVPYSYSFCMDVAIKCHVQGRYTDSLAFVVRACEIKTTPAALYLRALDELALNLCDDAASTAMQLKTLPSQGADFGWLREKLSSPLAVRLKALLELV
ncbi:MAG: hypothetical protein JWN70_4425 [Planctomycetaceae bacterium]|nr:hypothetical protein [Planctomycetaceae bacterium]